MTFEAIKQCGINKDVEGLKRIIDPTPLRGLDRIISPPVPRVSIDVRKKGNCHLTAAGELAREGNLEAVEFLRQHGASINKIAYGFAVGGHFEAAERYRSTFDASVNTIAYGYAQGGHFEQVERYRIEFSACINQIAFGYAFGGHDENAERYRTEHHASVDYIASGFAQGNQPAKAEIYRTEYGASVDFIARGFALCGNIEEADKYRTVLGANVNVIVRGFAQGGYKDQAIEYPTIHRASYAAVGLGFALGGHTADADLYCIEQLPASVNDIAFGFAVGGHVAEADRYRREFGANVDDIAYGFACDGNTAQAERYRIEFGASAVSIAEGFAQGGHTVEARRYQAMRRNHSTAKDINKPTSPESLLKNYIDTFKTRPITFLENFEYPAEYVCTILQAPPSIPVRIMSYGPFDYHAVMQMPETIPGSGKRHHPLLQGVLFEIRDIAPDTVTRNALNNIALASSASNAVSREAQVTFSRNQDGRPVPNIESELAATSIQNSI